MREERAVAGDGDGGEAGVLAGGVNPGRRDCGGGFSLYDGDENMLGVVRDAAIAPCHGGPAGVGGFVAGGGEAEEGGEIGGGVVEGDDAAAGGDVGLEGGDVGGGEGGGVGKDDKGRRFPFPVSRFRFPVSGLRFPVPFFDPFREGGVGDGVEVDAGAGEDAFKAGGELGGVVGGLGRGGHGGTDDGNVGGGGEADGGDGDGMGIGVGGSAPEGDAEVVGLFNGAGGAFKRGEGAEGEANGAAGAFGGKGGGAPAIADAEVEGDRADGLGRDGGGEFHDEGGGIGGGRGKGNVDVGAVAVGGCGQGRQRGDRRGGGVERREREGQEGCGRSTPRHIGPPRELGLRRLPRVRGWGRRGFQGGWGLPVCRR